MGRVFIRLRATERHFRSGARERCVKASSKLPIFDVRLLAAIAVTVITVAVLTDRERVQGLAPSRVARGDRGVQITSFAVSPTGGHIATTNTAGRITLRARESGWQIERFLDFPGYAMSVAYSPDGRYLAVVGTAPGICLWDLSSGTSQLVAADIASIQRAKHVIFSPDGQTLAVTNEHDGTVVLWDLATRRERMILHHPSPPIRIAFSSDGRGLATTGASDGSSILLWDLETGYRRMLAVGGPGHLLNARHVTGLAFSPDGALLACARLHEHCVRLWDLSTLRELTVFAEHAHFVTSVAFSPDGALMATASKDGMLGLWKISTGERLVSLDGRAISLQSVAFSPDGRTLVLATWDDDDLRLWDVAEILKLPPGTKSSPMKKPSALGSEREFTLGQLRWRPSSKGASREDG